MLEVFDSSVETLVDPNAQLTKVSNGFAFTEGPVWSFSEGHLTFVDLAGNAMYRYEPGRGVQSYREPSNFANGLAYDTRGRLLSCEHQTRRITIETGSGLETVVDHYDGKRLNAPNDLLVAGDGSIVFTDPHYGLTEGYGGPGDPEQPYRGVYRVPRDAREPELLIDDFEGPNGLALTSDETILYVVDSERGHIRAFGVGESWTLSGGDVFVELPTEGDGVPDGVKLDVDGNLYSTGPGGIWIVSADGRLVGHYKMPEVTANLAWGDDDAKTLYLTASTSVYALRCVATGHAPHRSVEAVES